MNAPFYVDPPTVLAIAFVTVGGALFVLCAVGLVWKAVVPSHEADCGDSAPAPATPAPLCAACLENLDGHAAVADPLHDYGQWQGLSCLRCEKPIGSGPARARALCYDCNQILIDERSFESSTK